MAFQFYRQLSYVETVVKERISLPSLYHIRLLRFIPLSQGLDHYLQTASVTVHFLCLTSSFS